MKILQGLNSLFRRLPLGVKYVLSIILFSSCYGFAFMGDANWEQDCHTLQITYLSGIANGPARVYWTGGGYITNVTVTLTGIIGDGWYEVIGGTTNAPYESTAPETGSPRFVEFPINSELAQEVVDNGGTFLVHMLGIGTDPYNTVGTCTTSFSLSVGDMTTGQNTAVPTQPPSAIPPTDAPPATNVPPPTDVPPTAIPPTDNPTPVTGP
jgi:hypothetical protein